MTGPKVLLSVLLLALTGCGSPLAGTVKGRVKSKGQPLAAGVVTLMDPSTGFGASAPLGPGGEFEIKESVRPGNYRVSWSMPAGELMIPGKSTDPTTAPPKNAPSRDLNEQTSQTLVEVKSGPNAFEIDLK